jgi:hypothetical protein
MENAGIAPHCLIQSKIEFKITSIFREDTIEVQSRTFIKMH